MFHPAGVKPVLVKLPEFAAAVVDVQDALASFDKARTELAAAEKALLAKLKAAGYA